MRGGTRFITRPLPVGRYHRPETIDIVPTGIGEVFAADRRCYDDPYC